MEGRVSVGDGVRLFEFTVAFDERLGDVGTTVFAELSGWVCVSVCKGGWVGR